MSDFPNTTDIATDTRRALEAMGVEPDALKGDVPVRTPMASRARRVPAAMSVVLGKALMPRP